MAFGTIFENNCDKNSHFRENKILIKGCSLIHLMSASHIYGIT